MCHYCISAPLSSFVIISPYLLQVQKTYRTLVGGRLEGQGYVDIPLDGKPSLTEYRSVSQTESGNHGWISTLDLLPHTGIITALSDSSAPTANCSLPKQYQVRW